VRLAAKIGAFVSGILLAALSLASPQPGEGSKGKELFQRRCGGCHSPERPMEGPPLRGVYGRRSASAADFQYSDALRNANLTWNDDSLDRWLVDPESFVPKTDMTFRVPNPDERRDLIAYLKSLSH
jgi:cytochrome c